MMKTISIEEVAKHTSKKDLWVIIHGKVYDLTAFLPGNIYKMFYNSNILQKNGSNLYLYFLCAEHPGGQKIIMKYAGRDATKAFDPSNIFFLLYISYKKKLGRLIIEY